MEQTKESSMPDHNAGPAGKADPQAPGIPTRINPVKRQQILISARNLFFLNGFSATSMEAVAKEARVGKATLYESFPNKIELLRAIILLEMEMRADHLVLEPAPPGQLRATLARFGHSLMELLLSQANVAIYRIISSEAPRHPELGRLFYDNGPALLIGRVAAYMAGLMEDGRIQYGNSRLVAAQFIGLIRADLQTRSLFGIDEDMLAQERILCVETGVDAFLRAFAR